MALPLAPIDSFEEGLQIIQEEADTLSTEYPAVLQFTVYLRRTWLPLKNNISVSIQINNFMENFHIEIFRKLGKTHSNIWNFLRKYYLLLLFFCALSYKIYFYNTTFADNLKNFITDEEKKVAILTEGRTVKRIRVRYDMNRNKRITGTQSLLTSGR